MYLKMLIARNKEKRIFENLLNSSKSEFVGVYGRRRVGKTFTIQNCCRNHNNIYFECTGTKDASLKEQLKNFTSSFAHTFYCGAKIQPPSSWSEAFEYLHKEIEKNKDKIIVIFFDELPWLSSPKSCMIPGLEYFWNNIASRYSNIKLIVCGSAASWMISKLVNAKGGLHNRLTHIIRIEPFNLSDTKSFLEYKGFNLSHQQIIEIYIILGGVPYYLDRFDKSKSITANINDLCFNKDGHLFGEFEKLFRSLFENSELNLQIFKIIASKHYGMSFKEIITKLGKKAGGSIKEKIEELEASGFIKSFAPYGYSKRNHFWMAIDQYSIFYLKWIEEFSAGKELPIGASLFNSIKNSIDWKIYAGFAFEIVCYKHIDKIVKKLGVDNILCFPSYYRKHGTKEQDGAQIDLLIDREDNAINICEIKFSDEEFVIDKKYAIELAKKIEVFREETGSKKQIFTSFITSSGIKKNPWYNEMVDSEVNLEDLF